MYLFLHSYSVNGVKCIKGTKNVVMQFPLPCCTFNGGEKVKIK